MNERKLLIDTDTRHTTSSGLQHSESFTSLAPFVGTIKIEHFSFLRWLVNFDSHCIYIYIYIGKRSILVIVMHASRWLQKLGNQRKIRIVEKKR